MAIAADTMLSNRYSVADLCITNQSLSEPNLPSDQNTLGNLEVLAGVLDELEAVIGPFQILSGFRTKELQIKLKEGGNPTAKTLSFHEVGRAVDIFPTTMDLATAFGLILADENLKNKFAEISIKESQNALHLSVNVPGDVREPKILGLNDEGTSYVRLTQEQIQSYVEPILAAAQEATAFVARNPVPTFAVLAGVAILAFLLMSGDKKRA